MRMEGVLFFTFLRVYLEGVLFFTDMERVLFFTPMVRQTTENAFVLTHIGGVVFITIRFALRFG
jgi:hypothetical protein